MAGGMVVILLPANVSSCNNHQLRLRMGLLASLIDNARASTEACLKIVELKDCRRNLIQAQPAQVQLA